ncbi:MAG: hypothetical protein MSA85_08740, partial [Prevotella sp.]|nr:hypothetical protein [Prevotella sp.]
VHSVLFLSGIVGVWLSLPRTLSGEPFIPETTKQKPIKLLIQESHLFQQWREIELREVFHLLAFRKVRENVITLLCI